MKKKIVYYVNMFLFGGIETSMLEYLRALDKTKFDITLIIGIHMYELEVLLGEIPPEVNVIYILKGQFFSRNYYLKRLKQLSLVQKILDNIVSPFRTKYFKLRIRQLFKDYNTIVDYALSLIKYNHILYKYNIIGYFHYSLKEYYLANMRKTSHFSQALNNYNKIVILNQHMYDEAAEIFPHLVSKFILMYNQFDFNRINRLAKSNGVNILQDYIVSVGRIEENQKDFTTLIKAYKIFRDKYNHTEKLVIVGSGKDSNKLSELIDSLDLSNDIMLVGHKINPFPWIYNSNLFVFSSKFEGMAMVLVEAMILNKAIVATDCPNGPTEVLMDGKCGILVKVGDYAAMALAMKQLLDDSKEYAQYVDEANLHLNRFDITKNTSRLEQLLNN